MVENAAIGLGAMRQGALEETLGIAQPTLCSESLVATRREGKNICSRLASPHALAAKQVLYAQFCTSAKPTRSRQ